MIKNLSLIIIFSLALTQCYKEDTVYAGNDYVHGSVTVRSCEDGLIVEYPSAVSGSMMVDTLQFYDTPDQIRATLFFPFPYDLHFKRKASK